jgi:hypothetical protein
MVQIRESSKAAGSRAPRSFRVAWFEMRLAAVVSVSLALAAAKSGRLDRLMPKDQPCLAYFTT